MRSSRFSRTYNLSARGDEPVALSNALAHAKLIVDRILRLGEQTNLDGLLSYPKARARYHFFLRGIFSKQRHKRAPATTRNNNHLAGGSLPIYARSPGAAVQS